MTAQPAISVIVPHYNQREALTLCLESLERQSHARDDFEVIVVDNHSSCDLSKIVEAFPMVRFLSEAKRGAAHARNCGMKAALGRNLAFIDADCVADEFWLESGLKALRGADLIGGAMRVTIEAKAEPTAIESFEQIFAFRQQRYIERKHFAVTANLFAKASAAAAIGPFRNGVPEDVDWCHRARALGFHLAFNDTSIISHPARRTWEELTAKWGRTVRERWNGFGGQGPAKRLKWTLLAFATALSAPPHLAVVATTQRIRGVDARVGAALTLIRIRFWRARAMMAAMKEGGDCLPATEVAEA